jgi:tripartite tricarboxylate transporter family receptor
MLCVTMPKPFYHREPASNIATEAVVRARPDGYTLLQASASNAWNAALYDNFSFNFIRDIAPIATVRRAAGVMEVHRSQSGQFPNSSPTPRLILAKSIWRRPGREVHRTI